jgi:hypothetical protein
VNNPFKKKSIVQQRKELRTKIGNLERNTKWPNRRKAATLSRYRQRYVDLGVELWQSIPFSGLDLTGAVVVNEEGERVNRYELGGYLGPNSDESFLKAETATIVIYKDGKRLEQRVPPGEEVDPGDYEEIEGFE